MGYTIHDIAKECNVNASTVSRALRNDSRVKKETREAIQQLAAKHGYTPNITARNLTAGKTNTIWLILGSLDNEIERKPAVQLSNLLRQQGYDLLLILHNNDNKEFERIINKLYQMVTDGAIILPPGTSGSKQLLKTLENLPVPTVFIDRWVPETKSQIVTSDNTGSVQHLTRFCHQCEAEIFFVIFENNNPVSAQRRKAAIEYLEANNLRYYTEITKENLSRHSGKPIAIVASSWGVLAQTSDEDITKYFSGRLVYGGFFDYIEYEHKNIFAKVMICRQDFDKIASIASEKILKMISDKHYPKESFVQVPPENFIEF